MAISPDQAAKKNLESIDEQLRKVVTQIDKELTAKYFGDNSVQISVENCHARVKKEILREYRLAGWDVTSKHSSHRNEQYECFTFTKKKVEHYDPREH